MKFLLSALVASRVHATHVSVCHDATYDVPLSRGSVCVGAGPVPRGLQCPQQGDRAVQHCLPSMFTYVDDGYCGAYENAVCELVRNNTWGCVFPSIKCEREKNQFESNESCAIWPYKNTQYGNHVWQALNGDINDQTYDEAWFQQETPAAYLGHLCSSPPKMPKSKSKPTLVESKAPEHEYCSDSESDVPPDPSNSVTLPNLSTSDHTDTELYPSNKENIDTLNTKLESEEVQEQVDCECTSLMYHTLIALVIQDVRFVSFHDTNFSFCPPQRTTMLRVFISAVQLCYFCNFSKLSALNVLVHSDAIYALKDDMRVCTGSGPLPVSTACPRRGDVAIGGCHSGLRSWNQSHQRCVAPEDAKCVELNGIWKCQFLSVRGFRSSSKKKSCGQTWSFEGKDQISDSMWKTSGTQETVLETSRWFTRESKPASLGVCGKNTNSYTDVGVRDKSSVSNQNGSEVQASDGTEASLSEISGVRLSDATEVPLSNGSEVQSSDGSEVQSSDGSEMRSSNEKEVSLSDGSEAQLADSNELPSSLGSGLQLSEGSEGSSTDMNALPLSDGREEPVSDASEESDTMKVLSKLRDSEMDFSDLISEDSGSGWVDFESPLPSSWNTDSDTTDSASTSDFDDYLLDVWSDSDDTLSDTEGSETNSATFLSEETSDILSGSESDGSEHVVEELFRIDSSLSDSLHSNSDSSISDTSDSDVDK
uniref:SSP5_? n=1 Tax=Albugo laibachii Nc14 TaxID=890382 RepID=F0WJP3_9STRA|nr:SSP5_? [Albugo laibachii Nc14]|eukprot:CCA21493.1 SSP5_? [Albugo laibachii Nc14]